MSIYLVETQYLVKLNDFDEYLKNQLFGQFLKWFW